MTPEARNSIDRFLEFQFWQKAIGTDRLVNIIHLHPLTTRRYTTTLSSGMALFSGLQQWVTFSAIFTIMIAMSTRAGYVELYKDANFKNKLLKVDNVLVDVCYNFICDKLDNTITSALWHGLPEKGSLFNGGDAVISFITDKDCTGGEVRRWTIRTQSSSVSNFPADFGKDGIGKAISSFKVWNTGTDGGLLNICAASESTVVLNATNSQWSETNDTNTIERI